METVTGDPFQAIDGDGDKEKKVMQSEVELEYLKKQVDQLTQKYEVVEHKKQVD